MSANNHQTFIETISGQRQSVAAGVGRGALSVLEWPYRGLMCARNRAFDWGLRKIHKLGRLTISVGNITTGGTGKTPMVIEMVQRLHRMGAKPAVLLRGYHARADEAQPGKLISDEALVLQDALQRQAMIEVAANRRSAARRILADQPERNVFVLDDAFQHRQVHRDCDVVLVDACVPFGFGHVLPRGLLRESPRGLRRADAVIVTHCDQVDEPTRRALDAQIERWSGRPPIAHTAHRWTKFYDETDRTFSIDDLRDLRAFAACGIGNPQAFFAAARQHVSQLVGRQAMADHHHYTVEDIQILCDQAAKADAQLLLLTEKDWVKCKRLFKQVKTSLPIVRPHLQLQFLDGSQALDTLLEKLLEESHHLTKGR